MFEALIIYRERGKTERDGMGWDEMGLGSFPFALDSITNY
jgi:hypothetical protein